MKIRSSILLIMCVLSLFAPEVLRADLVVTEIMYDPAGSDTGHEWVEVFNTGTSPADITALKLFEGNANHKIVTTGEKTIAPGAYAIIANNTASFQSDWPYFTGQIFRSAFSLGNSGDALSLRGTGQSDTIVSYGSVGAAGDGNSLQRSPESRNATFTPHTPSPGAVMSLSVSAPVPKSSPTAKKTTPKKTAGKDANARTEDVGAPSSESVDGSGVVQDVSTSSQRALVAESMSENNPYVWWGALAGLLVVGSAVVVAVQYVGKREWEIVEEEGSTV